MVHFDHLTANAKGIVLESVPADSGMDLGLALCPRQGDVQGSRYCVGEVMVGQSADQADGGVRCTQGNLNLVDVARRGGSLAVKAVTQPFQCPVGYQSVKEAIR